MKSLLKNHQHYSEIYLVEEFDNKYNKKWIIKSSSNKSGINDIRRELHGIDWYSKSSDRNLFYEIVSDNSSYINVKHLIIDGATPPFSSEIYQSNVRYIEIVVKHYCDVWHRFHDKTHCPLHGDLSLLGNVIFVDDMFPVFIDWEHFCENIAPIGFDILYFMFELIYFEILNTRSSLNKNLNHLSDMINLLSKKNCLSSCFLSNPLLHTINFIKDNNNIWGKQYKKFPILFYTPTDIDYIDKFLSEKI